MAADMCCKEYHCDMCGIKTRQYELRCPTCHEKVLFEKATICAVARQKDYEQLKAYANEHSVDGLNSIIVDTEPMIVSSTQIRKNIKLKGDFSDVPQQVEAYIKRNKLYL